MSGVADKKFEVILTRWYNLDVSLNVSRLLALATRQEEQRDE